MEAVTGVSIAGAILAGGRGRRIGGSKALAPLLGEPMIAHVAAILRPRTSSLAVVGDDIAAVMVDAEPLRDATDDAVGPLAGILSALEWAAACGAEWLAVAPCDTPLLPPVVVRRLLEGARASGLAYAMTSSGAQPLVSVWRANLAAPLRSAMLQGHPPAKTFMDQLGAAPVHFEDAIAFFNVNTPVDLAEAEEVLSARGRALLRQPLRS